MKYSTQHRRWIPEIYLRVAGAALVMAIVFVLPVVVATSAQAQTYTYNVLYAFRSMSDGGEPDGGLVLDAQGNLYGTANRGADYGCCGNVFKVDTSGNETVLYAFTGSPDGVEPAGNLVQDAQGNLYGTTIYGGDAGCDGGGGCGTVFKVDTNGNETVLYRFTGGADGAQPNGGLVLDSLGNLYGTAYLGGNLNCHNLEGSAGCGTMFALGPAGNLTVLYTFCSQVNCADGANPNGSLVRDKQGNLYGTTVIGGAYRNADHNDTCYLGCGTVFKVDAAGNETVLHSFDFGPRNGTPDGASPDAGLAMDAQGNLYGSTALGGAGTKGKREGTVFKLDASGNESLLYSFSGGGTAPGYPGGVIMDAAGNLYGTTGAGGAGLQGTVFELNTSGILTVLSSFGDKIGHDPSSSLAIDAAGNLYGTTYSGGPAYEGLGLNDGYGVVYDLLLPAEATTTTLTSSPNPSIYEQAVTFTAVVQSAAGTPSNGETVSFRNEQKTVLGTGTLSSGSAGFTTSTLQVGTTKVTAVYAGDPTHGGSTSNAVKQVVKRATSTTTLTSSPNPSTYGEAVTFTAVVAPAPSNGETVGFWQGAAELGTGSLSGGLATFTISILPVGANSIRALYGGDRNIEGSKSNVVNQVVDQAGK